MQNCERENRKLRHQLGEVRERARKLSEQQSQLAQGEVGRMRAQTEAAARELLELRHSFGRLRKVTNGLPVTSAPSASVRSCEMRD